MSRLLLCGSDDGFDHHSLGVVEDWPPGPNVDWPDEPPHCPYVGATCEHHCTAGARACVDQS